MRLRVACALALSLAGYPAVAAPVFVNGLALPGSALDQSGGQTVNSGRVGYFSDIYYNPVTNVWWGLSDRGPGGGFLSYDTRVQRFSIDVDPNTGAISSFAIEQTILFADGVDSFNGLAPNPANLLGDSFDPEGFVINPINGHMLVSDEYGPSLYEFDENGQFVRAFETPANLVPKVGSGVDYASTPPTLTAGREPNRGYEGLAISPDGKYAYAVLQNGTIQDGWTPSDRGLYTRIVKFDTTTGDAVAQYAYRLESAGQGRGISALVALGDDKFWILERNNRGVGVGATLASPDKNVFFIDLNGASDVTGINLPSTGNLPAGFTPVTKGAKVLDLDANTLAALGNKSPEKLEGLAVGPKLNDGGYLVLAGTDNDYSVTQNPSGQQFDVYFNFSLADPYAMSIQCPLGQLTGCFFTTGGGPATLTSSYSLLPGLLYAYKFSADDLTGYVAPSVPEPVSAVLLLTGLSAFAVRRRRPATSRPSAP
jgi:hypothetical protein